MANQTSSYPHQFNINDYYISIQSSFVIPVKRLTYVFKFFLNLVNNIFFSIIFTVIYFAKLNKNIPKPLKITVRDKYIGKKERKWFNDALDIMDKE